MPGESRHLYEFGPFRLDPGERLLARNGVPIPLPPKAFVLLVLLVERSGRLRSKEELMRAAWPETFVEENNLSQCISTLRKALTDDGDGQKFIETVPRLGYRFISPVRRCSTGIELDEPDTVRHSETRIVIHEDEQIEEEEVTEAAPESIPVDNMHGLAEQPAPPLNWRTSRWILLAVFMLCTLAAGFYWRARPARLPEVVSYLPIAQISHLGWPVATDGKDLYFVTSADQLARVPVQGGGVEFRSLNLPKPSQEIKDFSPVRQEALVTGGNPSTEAAESELWIASTTGPALRIADLYAHDASWSPDSEALVYAYQDGLYTARRDGSNPRLLARLPGTACCTSWSPGGKWIRFVVRQTAANSLWEVAADGSGLRLLMTDENISAEFKGRWTADGRYFIFPSRNGWRFDLWALPANSNNIGSSSIQPERLTNGPINLASPVPSKDGKQVFASGWLEEVEILGYDAKTSSFLPFLPGISADSLAFSPDGQWVVYSTHPERILWRSRVDGSERLRLTSAPMESLLPQWSPDGKVIAFMGRSQNEPWRIYFVAAAGGPLKSVVASPDDQATPTWSADGTKLAYAGAPWKNGFAASSTAIHYLNLQNHQLTTLPDSIGLWSPRWSPDGQYLVAETLDSHGLKLFDFRKHTWRPLARLSRELLGYTAWSRDSRYVYFNADGERGRYVYRVSVKDPRPTVTAVIDLKQVPVAYTLGQWFTLGPDGSALITRDSSVRNIYALDMRLP